MHQNCPDKVIFSSRKKCARMVLFCLLWVAFFLTIMVVSPNPLTWAVAAIGLGFIAPFFAFFLHRVFVRLPAIIISSVGLIDSSSAVGAGLIKWNELSGIGTTRYGFSKYLALDVPKPQPILSRIPIVKRIIVSINITVLNSRFLIHGNAIEGSIDSLFDEITSYYQDHIQSKT
jgi:hypothetical protein